MGIHHCDCGATLCGESFSCETCGCGDGDGTMLCDTCAEIHCASDADREQANIDTDTELLTNLSSWGGVYTDNGKHARQKSLQSTTVQEILKLIVKNPERLQELLPRIREVFSKKGVKRTASSTASTSTSSSSSSSTSSSASSSSQPKKKAKISDTSKVVHIDLTLWVLCYLG